VEYHVYLRHGTSVCCYFKTWIESGPVTADLTTTVVHSSKLLINDVKPYHSPANLNYCEIITFRCGLIFVVFVGNLQP